MPRTDVAVVGAGLAGMTAGIALADAGLRVTIVATGHAASHWAPGGIDVAALPGVDTPRAAVEILAQSAAHPYRFLGRSVGEALDWLLPILEAEGLSYTGGIDDPIAMAPTSIGATRPVQILPASMAAARAPWQPGERLVVCGPAGFRDFWPEQIAASLRRAGSWRGAAGPERVDAVSVPLPGLAARNNLSGLDIARMFDDASWRSTAIDAMARAVDRSGGGPGRVCLPAILGLDDHAAAFAEAERRLALAAFEIPLAPPSVAGLRLYRALRRALVARGGRIQVGEAAHGFIGGDRRVYSVVMPAAAREFELKVDGVVLATGGIAGGGIVAEMDGRLRETVLGLPVEAADAPWLRPDPFEAGGHALETCGIRTDSELRPVAPHADGPPLAGNVRVCGSLLAGQRYLRERCGDGVAIASGLLAARSLTQSAAAARQVRAGAAV